MELIQDTHPIRIGDNIKASASMEGYTEILSVQISGYVFNKDSFEEIEQRLPRLLKREINVPIIVVECTRTNTASYINIELYRLLREKLSLYAIRKKSKEEGSWELQTLDKINKIVDDYMTCLLQD